MIDINREFPVTLILILVSVLGGCMDPQESDLQKAIGRDDTFLRTYLSQNEINATETPLGLLK